jgi:preprotein translocase subunit SecE
MNPPSVYDVTRPKSHKMRSITAIVVSMVYIMVNLATQK